MKYLHLHGTMFLGLLIVLSTDSLLVAQHVAYAQWVSNLVTFFAFIWIYQHTSKQVKQLMLFGLMVALGGETLFALILKMYSYRLGNLPLYVPFGHSIIYAGVYYLVKEPLFKQHQSLITQMLFIGMIVYSTLWLLLANDVLGFICMLVILGIFKWRDKTKPFFLVMFFTIVYLELLGTYFQCWLWPSYWFNTFEWIPSANPPSGISVFYFGFDAGCLWFYKRFNPQKWQRLKRFKTLRCQIK